MNCMSKPYEVLKLNSDSKYRCMVVLCNSHSPYDYLEYISNDMISIYSSGKILIDQFLHSGNTNKRFIEFDIIENKLQNSNFVEIKKNSIYRKTTCDFLKNSELLIGSILTSIQRRMINKGIVI